MDIYHTIVGLPESGKTTYLAALWHIIDAGEINTVLQLDRQIGNTSYLNEIVNLWRKCLKVPRTSQGSEEKELSIFLKNINTGSTIALGFPDLSGETFEHQFGNRECSQEYIKNYEKEGGLLLFINANKGEDGMRIRDLGVELRDHSGQEVAPETNVWNADMVPHQVKLVELLQFLQMRPFKIRRRRLALVISAWDVIDNSSIEPEDWLKREYPLLYQFCVSNIQSFEFRIYGVSAQGGELPKDDSEGSDEEKESREKLLLATPSERIVCVGKDVNDHDITAPINWLSELE